MQILDYDQEKQAITLHMTYLEFDHVDDVISGINSMLPYQSEHLLGVSKTDIRQTADKLTSILTQMTAATEGKKFSANGHAYIPLIQKDAEMRTITVIIQRDDLGKITAILRGVYKTLAQQDTTLLETTEETLQRTIGELESLEATLSARDG